jgi:hypothetical protein
MLPDTLLSIQPNQKGPFVSWLEELGLKDLISRYSLPKLLEWGWLIPQYQVVFPAEYFKKPISVNILEAVDHSNHNSVHDRLLGYGESWLIENTKEPFWLLHPFCRPDSVYSNLLNLTDSSATPNVYYFFHWQAYSLIDVVRTASMGAFPILNTPDIEEDIDRISNCKIKPSDALNQPHRWGGLAKPMTWISHYRAFRDALPCKIDKQCVLHQQGAEALARYLEIDAEILEKAVKEQLLQRLAGSWLKTNYECEEWTFQAWPYLQKDIFFAMEWLCTLNGKSFSDYFKKWEFSPKREVWPPLHKVLPFEYFEDRQYFLSMLPRYKNFYSDILPEDGELEKLVTRLQTTNYPFDSLLNAFRQFHEHLMYKPHKKGSLDFRVLRPLDYYSLLAIRAETCLRYALQKSDILTGGLDTLKKYITELARQKNISTKVIEKFEKHTQDNKKNNTSDITNLRQIPDNPIRDIMEINCVVLDKSENDLLKAFLCCNLARNYFAHHTYLDKEFMQSQREQAAFMLVGVLVTVLKLLDD